MLEPFMSGARLLLVYWYRGTLVHMTEDLSFAVERIQTGVRMEKRLLKVLKALAEYHDLSLGDLLEGIVLHAFEGKAPFGSESIRRIAELRSEEHTSELQSHSDLVCRLLLEKKN